MAESIFTLENALKQRQIKFHKSGGEHIYLDCIKCGKKDKMYFNLKKNIGDCKVCQSTIFLREIFNHFQITAKTRAPSIRQIREKVKRAKAVNIKDYIKQQKEKVVKSSAIIPAVMPADMLFASDITSLRQDLPQMIMFFDYPFTYQYLYFVNTYYVNFKHFFLKALANAEIGICFNEYDFHKNRLIIPIYNENKELIGVQSRSLSRMMKESTANISYLTGSRVIEDLIKRFPSNHEDKKYLFSKDFKAGEALYGIHEFTQKKDYVVLVEGAMCSIYMGVQNVFATFGKKITGDQIRLLLKAGVSPDNHTIILLWDGDAWDEPSAAKKGIVMLKKFFKVKALKLPPGEQPDNYTRRYLDSKINELMKSSRTILELDSAEAMKLPKRS